MILQRSAEKKFERLIQGRGNDGILWKLRDFLAASYEDNPILIILGLCLLFIVYELLKEIWIWILNFTQECDMDCFSYTRRTSTLGLEFQDCFSRNMCLRNDQFWNQN